MKKTFAAMVSAAVLLALLAGCLGGGENAPGGAKQPVITSPPEQEKPAGDTTLQDNDIPLLEEDTVEIGEMLPDVTEAATDTSLEETEIPLMEENDEVEIGEML